MDDTWNSLGWREEDVRVFTRFLMRDNQQQGIIFTDATGVITGWNRGAVHITGHTAEQAIGQRVSLLFTPEDRERGLDQQEMDIADSVGFAEDERWHLRRDGSRFWTTGLSFPMRSEDGRLTGFTKIFRDATHLRSRMAYLENLVKQCSAYEAERNTFLGTIAHELRNPLSPIKTVLAIFQNSPEVAQRHATPLKILDRQIGFLERLVEDLVDLTRAQVGKLRIDYQRFVVQQMLTESVESCRAAAQAKKVALRHVLPAVPLMIDADPQRLEQVVVNLLNNAIKFTPPGGDVWLTCTADQTHCVLSVKDNGQGIEPELLPQIFEAFTQASDAHSGRGAGMGIGLSVAKEIVTLHRGGIEARSEGPGKGSEFYVRIPLRQAGDLPPQARGSAG